MDKNKNKGLVDAQDGEFILNESGTSVTIDLPEEGNVGDPAAGRIDKSEEEKEDK